MISSEYNEVVDTWGSKNEGKETFSVFFNSTEKKVYVTYKGKQSSGNGDIAYSIDKEGVVKEVGYANASSGTQPVTPQG